jgi:P-type E1-E2 ATPase
LVCVSFHIFKKTSWIEGAAILLAVAIVGFVSAFNNWDKERKFRKLNKEANSQNVTVIRGGEAEQIKTEEVVVGDLIALDTGES